MFSDYSLFPLNSSKGADLEVDLQKTKFSVSSLESRKESYKIRKETYFEKNTVKSRYLETTVKQSYTHEEIMST